MFMIIYSLIEWRFIPTRWKLEKMYTICERAKRASRFFNICVENIWFFSNLNIYIADKSLFVGTIIMSMIVFATLVIWSCSVLTRKQETWEIWFRASGESEPKLLYFCVRKMFYILTRNSRKNYKWLRASQFVCVCLKHANLLNILLINHMVCRYNKLCPCVRNTRDMVLRKPETQEKHINYCERAEILALLRRKHVILLNQSIISCW